MIVAEVVVLQRIKGLSGREVVDRFAFDARWKYVAGGLDFDRHASFARRPSRSAAPSPAW